MALQRRIVGRLPIFLGEYVPGKTYQSMNNVSYLGSLFQVDTVNNNYTSTSLVPCGDPQRIVTPTGEIKWQITANYPWIIVADLTTAYMNSKEMQIIDASISYLDQKIDDTSTGINGRIDEIVNQYLNETENPEFVEVHTDNDDKVLYGVQDDGNFYFGAGVPSQIKSYVMSLTPGMDPTFNGVVYYGINPDPVSEENQQRSVSMSIAGVYHVTTLSNSHIYFFIPSSVTSFYATINGLEIPFTVTDVTIEGKSYKKYESVNTYDEATFNIVIQ